MEDLLNDQDAQKIKGRPTFLTVLCILTFVGSGWGLLGSIMGYFNADKNAAAIVSMTKDSTSGIQKIGQSNQGAEINNMLKDSLSKFTAENYRHSALGNLVAAIFCLLGAFMMWGLKKNGFYLYLIGTVVGIVVPLMVFGSSLLALGSSAVIAFFGILFVVLYAVNLKHMR